MTRMAICLSLASPAVCGANPSSAKAAMLSSTVSPRSEPATSAPEPPLGSRFLARRCASATDSNHAFATADPLLLGRTGATASSTGCAHGHVALSATLAGRVRSGDLDRRDVELHLDPVADQHAAGVQHGVPGQRPVAALDGQRALEADPGVAERVQRRAGEREVHRDRLGDVLDGEVAGDPVDLVVDLLDLGGDEDHL